MNGNLFSRFDAVFSEYAEQVCLRLPDGTGWTYNDLHRATGRIGAVLRQQGVRPGDRVVVQVPKTPDAIALYLATLQVGAVYVPLNTDYTEAEVAYFLGDAEPSLYVTAEDSETGLPTLTLDAYGEGSLKELASSMNPDDHIVDCSREDLAAILYTSGTTGRSKGAMLTHGNLTSNADTLISYWGWRSDDVLLHALPIYHVHGLFVASHCVLLTGSSMIFLPRFDVEEVVHHLSSSTVLMGVPTFYTRLLRSSRFTSEVAAGIRLFVSGSAPLTEQTFEAFVQRTGHRILERYGMSETGMNTSNPLDGERVAGTVGFPLPGVDARVVNEEGDPLPVGEIGGIEVRGPNVFSGYWRMPEKTRDEFRDDGYFMTGDMGIVDAEGRYSIVGREKDLVISGGLNVYPKEIEILIDTVPGVIESAVVGVPHPDFGEAVIVVVASEMDIELEDVNVVLTGKLARFKQPKRLLRVEELPRNAMGKVQKNVLRELCADRFTWDE
ncbi:MAG: malonyl-CoA synthase [Pseudomonadota bacterium]|nr:malonyl-CoA synthase [Pseudomonadota bacterium]